MTHSQRGCGGCMGDCRLSVADPGPELCCLLSYMTYNKDGRCQQELRAPDDLHGTHGMSDTYTFAIRGRTHIAGAPMTFEFLAPPKHAPGQAMRKHPVLVIGLVHPRRHGRPSSTEAATNSGWFLFTPLDTFFCSLIMVTHLPSWKFVSLPLKPRLRKHGTVAGSSVPPSQAQACLSIL